MFMDCKVADLVMSSMLIGVIAKAVSDSPFAFLSMSALDLGIKLATGYLANKSSISRKTQEVIDYVSGGFCFAAAELYCSSAIASVSSSDFIVKPIIRGFIPMLGLGLNSKLAESIINIQNTQKAEEGMKQNGYCLTDAVKFSLFQLSKTLFIRNNDQVQGFAGLWMAYAASSFLYENERAKFINHPKSWLCETYISARNSVATSLIINEIHPIVNNVVASSLIYSVIKKSISVSCPEL